MPAAAVGSVFVSGHFLLARAGAVEGPLLYERIIVIMYDVLVCYTTHHINQISD